MLRLPLLIYGLLATLWSPIVEAHGHEVPEPPEGLEAFVKSVLTDSPSMTLDEAWAYAARNDQFNLTPAMVRRYRAMLDGDVH